MIKSKYKYIINQYLTYMKKKKKKHNLVFKKFKEHAQLDDLKPKILIIILFKIKKNIMHVWNKNSINTGKV